MFVEFGWFLYGFPKTAKTLVAVFICRFCFLNSIVMLIQDWRH